MRNAALFLLATLALANFGCSSDDDAGSAAKGAAPTLANLSFKTTTVAVGKVEVVQGTVDFDDADGDFDAIEGQLKFGSQSQAIPRYAATTSGQKSGTLNLAFQIGAPAAGTAEIELWGVDKNGNTSNKQRATIEAK